MTNLQQEKPHQYPVTTAAPWTDYSCRFYSYLHRCTTLRKMLGPSHAPCKEGSRASSSTHDVPAAAAGRFRPTKESTDSGFASPGPLDLSIGNDSDSDLVIVEEEDPFTNDADIPIENDAGRLSDNDERPIDNAGSLSDDVERSHAAGDSKTSGDAIPGVSGTQRQRCGGYGAKDAQEEDSSLEYRERRCARCRAEATIPSFETLMSNQHRVSNVYNQSDGFSFKTNTAPFGIRGGSTVNRNRYTPAKQSQSRCRFLKKKPCNRSAAGKRADAVAPSGRLDSDGKSVVNHKASKRFCYAKAKRSCRCASCRSNDSNESSLNRISHHNANGYSQHAEFTRRLRRATNRGVADAVITIDGDDCHDEGGVAVIQEAEDRGGRRNFLNAGTLEQTTNNADARPSPHLQNGMPLYDYLDVITNGAGKRVDAAAPSRRLDSEQTTNNADACPSPRTQNGMALYNYLDKITNRAGRPKRAYAAASSGRWNSNGKSVVNHKASKRFKYSTDERSCRCAFCRSNDQNMPVHSNESSPNRTSHQNANGYSQHAKFTRRFRRATNRGVADAVITIGDDDCRDVNGSEGGVVGNQEVEDRGGRRNFLNAGTLDQTTNNNADEGPSPHSQNGMALDDYLDSMTNKAVYKGHRHTLTISDSEAYATVRQHYMSLARELGIDDSNGTDQQVHQTIPRDHRENYGITIGRVAEGQSMSLNKDMPVNGSMGVGPARKNGVSGVKRKWHTTETMHDWTTENVTERRLFHAKLCSNGIVISEELPSFLVDYIDDKSPELMHVKTVHM